MWSSKEEQVFGTVMNCVHPSNSKN